VTKGLSQYYITNSSHMTESTLNPSRMIINSIPGLITIIIGQCRELVPKEAVFNPSRLIQEFTSSLVSVVTFFSNIQLFKSLISKPTAKLISRGATTTLSLFQKPSTLERAQKLVTILVIMGIREIKSTIELLLY